MLRSYIRTATVLKQLRNDAKGVVSFEYVILAACIIAIVGTAFGAGTGPVKDVLISALGTIITRLAVVVGT